MRVSKLKSGILVLATATFAWAAAFQWDGGGSDDNWDNTDNWTCTAGTCGFYPDDTGDDAWIPSSGSPWTVDIVSGTTTIDDLTIQGSVTFGKPSGGSGDHILNCDSIRINSGVTATVTDGVKITTD